MAVAICNGAIGSATCSNDGQGLKMDVDMSPKVGGGLFRDKTEF